MNTAAMRAHWAHRPRPRTTMLAVVPPAVEELVVQMAALHAQVPLTELLSPSRRLPVSRARTVAMLVLSEELGWGPTRIAGWLGREVSTVWYALDRARRSAVIRQDAQQVRLLVDERLQGYGVR